MLILGTCGILAKSYMGVKYERIQLSKPREDKPIFATLSDVFFFFFMPTRQFWRNIVDSHVDHLSRQE